MLHGLFYIRLQSHSHCNTLWLEGFASWWTFFLAISPEDQQFVAHFSHCMKIAFISNPNCYDVGVEDHDGATLFFSPPISTYWDQGWGLQSRFPPIRYFPNFSTSPKYILAIEYHVHIWQVSLTPIKYECDSKNVTGTFARSKILLTEKFTNRSLGTPTPERNRRHLEEDIFKSILLCLF